MTVDCLSALVLQLFNEPIAGKRVLEVGSQDVNGSIRPFVEQALKPREYVGADMATGKGVDVVVNSSALIEKFGKESFDVVLSTSALEHIEDWKAAIHNIKGVCKPGGLILVTTCSRYFAYHGYPYDFWRFELDDLKEIFSDCRITALLPVFKHLVFVKAIKPQEFVERGLDEYAAYSLVAAQKVRMPEPGHFRSWRFRKLVMRARILNALRSGVDYIGGHII